MLDFEANCVPNKGQDQATWSRYRDTGIPIPRNFIQEIVEFPIVMLRVKVVADGEGRTCTADLEQVAEFRSYVRPELFPLHPFCTELCGITESNVANAPAFAQVL